MATGATSTYALTGGVTPLNVEPVINLLDPFDVPLCGMYGSDGRSTLARGDIDEIKYSWIDDTLNLPKSLVNEALDDSETEITLDTNDGIRYSVGDSIRIDNEEMRVTGVSGDTLTVTRGIKGTSAASHSDNAIITITGRLLAEGSDPEAARFVDRTENYNYTSIFGPEKVEATGTDRVVRKYGVTDEYQYQLAKHIKEMWVTIEQGLQYSARLQDTTNKWRSLGGLDYWITTNVDSSTTTITEATILAQLQACYEAGGNPDRLMVGPKQKRVISAFATGLQIQINRADNGRGQKVDYFESDFANVDILLNRNTKINNAWLFARDQAELCTLRPMQYKPLADTGDSSKGMIVAEYGFKFRRQRHAAKFNALT